MPPGKVALVHEDERWTWERLERRSAQWATYLIGAGVAPDDFVAFALANGPEFIALTFGIYRAGAIPAPLSPKLVDREIRDIVDLLQPAAFVGDHPAMAAAAIGYPAMDAEIGLLPSHVSASWKACPSGGSSGRPKAIVDGRAAQFAIGTDFIGIPAEGRVLILGPLYHNATFSAAVFALWRGSALVMMSRFDAEATLALIEQERVDWALMVPTMMHRILQLPEISLTSRDLSSWTMVVHTAAAMAAASKRGWIDRFGADHIWEVYGATEGLFRTWIGGGDWLAHPGSVGRSADGYRLSIRDDGGSEVTAGVAGEIYAIPPGGPGSSYRYIGAERRTLPGGWESVGDVGHLDRDGYLYIADRRADLIVSGGVNVWPAEIEAAILEHPAIRSCAVLGLPDDDLGQRVHAVIEINDPIGIAEIKQFLTPRLAPQKIPRSLTCVREPVRDDAGKVRKALWREHLSGADHVH